MPSSRGSSFQGLKPSLFIYHIYINKSMYIHIDMYVILYHLSHQGSLCVCVCTYTYIYTRMCVCIYICMCVYICVCVYMYKHTHMYILDIHITYKVKESVSYSVMSDSL